MWVYRVIFSELPAQSAPPCVLNCPSFVWLREQTVLWKNYPFFFRSPFFPSLKRYFFFPPASNRCGQKQWTCIGAGELSLWPSPRGPAQSTADHKYATRFGRTFFDASGLSLYSCYATSGTRKTTLLMNCNGGQCILSKQPPTKVETKVP